LECSSVPGGGAITAPTGRVPPAIQVLKPL